MQEILRTCHLSLDWPAEREDVRSKGKLDERFLPSCAQTQRRRLPFFPDLHTEVWRSWEKPFSYRVLSTQTSHYSSILNKEVHGYGEIHKVEETLASHLSPESSSSTRSPVLPTKPMRTTSALVGKAYSAAGQAAACLHTMSLLQAYQAQLLADLDEVESIGPNAVCELHQATDLSLRAAKETAKSIGRSMAALVATERHLWFNLINIKGKDKNVLMDAPLSSSGLFGDAVNLVVERFQESAKQAAAFQKLLPRHIYISGAAE